MTKKRNGVDPWEGVNDRTRQKKLHKKLNRHIINGPKYSGLSKTACLVLIAKHREARP
eukprot:gene37186-18918_t